MSPQERGWSSHKAEIINRLAEGLRDANEIFPTINAMQMASIIINCNNENEFV